jgi:hypothetical protein
MTGYGPDANARKGRLIFGFSSSAAFLATVSGTTGLPPSRRRASRAGRGPNLPRHQGRPDTPNRARATMQAACKDWRHE